MQSHLSTEIIKAMQNVNTIIGQRIQELRKEAGMTQTQLAEK